jgi:hypothetical protein
MWLKPSKMLFAQPLDKSNGNNVNPLSHEYYFSHIISIFNPSIHQ